MMRPQSRSRSSAGSAAFVAWNAADRLIAMTASQRSSGKVVDRRDVLDAGVVDQDVDAAECRVPPPRPGRAISAGFAMSAAT